MTNVTTLSKISDTDDHSREADRPVVKAGRSTSAVVAPPNMNSRITGLFNAYAQLAYNLPFEILGYIELLARYNPDYSQAVENIRTLANSGHELIVKADSDLQERRIKAMLEEKARLIQESHGGIDGLIDKLLNQAATYGAMCGEWVTNEDLTEVVDFVDLNPKQIRFFWEKDQDRFCPYQKVSGEQAKEAERNGQNVINNCVKLNETTFRYYAFDAAPQSPYGTPPFLAALGNLAIQRDMQHNMAQIVKKIGLLGIIDMKIKPLQVKPGETTENYFSRASAYLEEYGTAVEEMVKEGGIVHYDDAEIQSFNISGNASGATNIFKQNEEQVFSGLKSMPSVQGRSYSTTETYAGVAYDIIIRNTYKYQRAAKRMIESGYYLMTQLAGMNPEGISLQFKPNKTLHRLQIAQAEKLEISNAWWLWYLKVLDHRGFSQRLGYAEPVEMIEDAPTPPELARSTASSTQAREDGTDGRQNSDSEISDDEV